MEKNHLGIADTATFFCPRMVYRKIILSGFVCKSCGQSLFYAICIFHLLEMVGGRWMVVCRIADFTEAFYTVFCIQKELHFDNGAGNG